MDIANTRGKETRSNGQRLSREQWLSRALEVLEEYGGSRLRIDKLTEMVGVSKGSFYWHFKNRKDFVISLARYWAVRYTTGVVPPLVVAIETPKRGLLELMKMIDEGGLTRYDLAIRAWASHEPEVLEIVREADAFRVDYVRSLFEAMGFEGDDLEMRTRTFVVFHSFERPFSQQLGLDELEKQRALRLELLTSRS